MKREEIIYLFLVAGFIVSVASFPVDGPTDGQVESNFRPNTYETNGFVNNKEQTPTVDELRMRLYLLSWLQNLTRDPVLNERIKAKRTCFVNAGLSHSCDYKNALAAIDEGRFFTSDQSPGKK